MSNGNFPVIVPSKLPVTKKIDLHHVKCHFVHVDVELDRNSYRNCEFDNVVFVYNGGPMEFCNNTVRGFTIRSDNAEINNMLHLLDQLGLINVGKNDS